MSSARPAPSKKTFELLQEFEVGGGEKYYTAKLSKFTWPGGASGPTIAIGIDCAYYTEKELADIFQFLAPDQIKLIQGAVDKKGKQGAEYVHTLRQAGIEVSWADAVNIFNKYTWNKFSTLTEKTFPGILNLHEDAYGAIVSLVFNRGTSLSGPNRTEMLDIKGLIPKKDYKGIAEKLRSMKRIWRGQGLDGLLTRREAEAVLVESCIS